MAKNLTIRYKLESMLKKIKRYLVHGLWNFSLREKKGVAHFFFKILRIAVLAIRGFFEDSCALRASSLTFYSLLSIVPIFALIFAIAQGFGLQEHLEMRILEKFQDNSEFVEELFVFSDRMLLRAKSGILAGVGAVMLFWSATSLLLSMETTFNWIWKVKRLRSFRRILSDYFAIILIAPLLFLISSSLSLYLTGFLKEAVHQFLGETSLGVAALFFVRLIPYVLLWILYALLYYLLPNTRVRFSAALAGGFVAGAFLLIAQAGYIYFQTYVTQYSAIYGSFAALPLFLLWVQINWFLLLLGVEISYACQTVERNEYAVSARQMSGCMKMVVAIWVVKVAVERTIEEKPITLELFVKEKKVPYAIAEAALQMVADAGILTELKEKKKRYLPERDIRRLRISDVIEALEMRGENELVLPQSHEILQINQSLRSFWELIEKNENNYYLKDL